MAEILQQKDGVLSFEILVDGNKIDDTIELVDISVEMELNKITSATISVLDGGSIGAVNDSFKVTEGKVFVPGNEIEIKAGYVSKNETIFKGIIVSQGLKISSGNSHMVITCKDKAVKMTKGRYNAIFKDSKDSDAITSIAGKYGIKTDIDTTEIELPVLMQYNSSDWDFVVIRAEANNMMVFTHQNELKVKKVDFSTSPKYEIKSSQFVIDIDLNLDAENISDSYKLSAWDEASQKIVENTVKLGSELKQGNISAKKISKAVDNGDVNHYSSTSISKNELKVWGESLANKAALSKIQGKITIPGTGDILAGDILALSDFSQRFNGNTFISKVIHNIQEGDWITTLHVGRYPQWHASLPDVEENRASGLLPGVNGSQIATVKKIHEDLDGNYRVLVQLPTFTGTGQEDGIWARIAFPYASADAGIFFFPEIGDEVLLNFINNDPRFAVITGALYSKKNKPKEAPDEKNQFKSIYSKSGINIRFDDDKKILTIATPSNNTFILDDDNKSITVKDENNNSLVLDKTGIVLDSSKDIKISAKGDIDISATGGINVKATADAKVDGLNVQLSAKTGFTAKGNASAEISAAGQTTVKGAMVMIN